MAHGIVKRPVPEIERTTTPVIGGDDGRGQTGVGTDDRASDVAAGDQPANFFGFQADIDQHRHGAKPLQASRTRQCS